MSIVAIFISISNHVWVTIQHLTVIVFWNGPTKNNLNSFLAKNNFSSDNCGRTVWELGGGSWKRAVIGGGVWNCLIGLLTKFQVSRCNAKSTAKCLSRSKPNKAVINSTKTTRGQKHMRNINLKGEQEKVRSFYTRSVPIPYLQCAGILEGQSV
jgi:hypothetical protein